MDIRNFFKPPATPTAVSKDALPAKKLLVTSPSLLTSTSATKAKMPTTTKSVVATKKRKRPASAAVPSAAELKRAKKIVAAAAKAKKEKEKDDFFCPVELMECAKAGTLHRKLQECNTNALKGYCQDSNLKYGGAKYKLFSRLLEHVDEAVRREKFDTLRANAEGGEDPTAAAQLHFANVKSFNAACNLFDKHYKKLSQHPTAAVQLRTMIGLTRGFDALLLKAITGSNRGKYNGKYGEEGMEGQHRVSVSWRAFLTKEGSTLSEKDWTLAAEFLSSCLPTGDYGFSHYGYHGFDGFEDTLTAAQKEAWAAGC